jgi:hypothetical protein
MGEDFDEPDVELGRLFDADETATPNERIG